MSLDADVSYWSGPLDLRRLSQARRSRLTKRALCARAANGSLKDGEDILSRRPSDGRADRKRQNESAQLKLSSSKVTGCWTDTPSSRQRLSPRNLSLDVPSEVDSHLSRAGDRGGSKTLGWRRKPVSKVGWAAFVWNGAKSTDSGISRRPPQSANHGADFKKAVTLSGARMLIRRAGGRYDAPRCVALESSPRPELSHRNIGRGAFSSLSDGTPSNTVGSAILLL